MTSTPIFLNKFEKNMVFVATKIEQNRFISSIKNGMISLMAILMVGSISLIISGLGSLFSPETAVSQFLRIMARYYSFHLPLLSVCCRSIAR